MLKNKITLLDVFGAIVDIAMMCVRPFVFMLVWNYCIAYNTTIPSLDFLQVVGIIILFHILISYIPFTSLINEYFHKNSRNIDRTMGEQ